MPRVFETCTVVMAYNGRRVSALRPVSARNFLTHCGVARQRIWSRPRCCGHSAVIVNDNPAAPKIGMALLRCEACFTRDISILPDKRGHSIQQVMPPRGDANG